MEKKSLLYGSIGIFGIVLIMSALVWEGKVPDAVDGMLMGVGSGLIGIGFFLWRFFHWKRSDPAKWKQYEIEARDERNMIIQFRAKAVAGEVLQWMVMMGAWAAIFLGAPLWVIFAIIGIFLCKTVLELCLMARYQKEM